VKTIKKYIFFLCISLLYLDKAFTSDLQENHNPVDFKKPYDFPLSEEDYCFLEEENQTEEELLELRSINTKKPTTLIIFAAADNDLYPFIWKNIRQMEAIGSNENINVIVQLNTPGSSNPTKRYLIKKGKRLLVPAQGADLTTKLNSGSPQTLVDCASWAMKHYPADNLIINLWNHGSGIYDPGTSRTIKSSELFHINPTTHMLDLDRNIGYIDLLNQNNEKEEAQRGICFDETFRSYMSGQDLKFALREIQLKVLGGKKIAMIWFDACLMSMLEVATICKDHVDYLVGSQEVELASGSNYEFALRPFLDKSLTPKEFACHIVNSYEKAYQPITRDYTQSALDLSGTGQIETNINKIAIELMLAIRDQKNNSVIATLKQSKSRPFCTCFEEPSYIDLRHFYTNLQANISNIRLKDPVKEASIKENLARLLHEGIGLINTFIVANKTGSNLQRAGGISIYFPERGMFNSYPRSEFAQTNSWNKLLIQYLLSKK